MTIIGQLVATASAEVTHPDPEDVDFPYDEPEDDFNDEEYEREERP